MVLIEERDLISGPMERKAAVGVQPLLDIKESTWESEVFLSVGKAALGTGGYWTPENSTSRRASIRNEPSLFLLTKLL